jgi:hypothetical protein
MGKAVNLYSHKIKFNESFGLSANLAFLAIFFTFMGGIVSFILYYLFDEYGPDDTPPRNLEWEKRSLFRKVADVSLEVVSIALLSFWLTYFINSSIPIIPLSPALATYVDTYTTGMFFMYTVFLFSNDLNSKLKFIYNETLGKQFDKIFPNVGSILDFNLSYKTEKTNQSS